MLARRVVNGARRHGVVAILMAISLVALLGVVAIALDGGGLLSERRRAQATADSAALAAASHLFDNYWVYSGAGEHTIIPGARASAYAEAAANGYTDDGTTSKVT